MRLPRDPHLRELAADVPTGRPGRKRINPDSKGTRPTNVPPAPTQLPTDIDPRHVQSEREALVEVAEAAVAGGLSIRNATRLIMKQHVLPDPVLGTKPRWERHVIVATIKEVLAEWEASFEETITKAREHQVERLRQDLARMRSRANPPWPSINQHEQLLARMLGTLQPARVQIDVMQAVKVSIAAYLADMTPEERDAMVDEQLALEARGRVLDLPAAAE